MQKRIEEYRVALREMEEANNREPNGALKWKERDMLKRMLEDYSRGLEEFLDYPDEYGGQDYLEDQLTMVRARIDVVDVGMPLDFSETRFDVMIESLAASLEECEGQVLEFSQLQSKGFQVFKLQCNFLVDTLSPAANERLLRYNKTLELVKDLEVVAFCIESLSELARQFQGVTDLLTMCCGEQWWITALDLANAPPKFGRCPKVVYLLPCYSSM
jgi:hypothetical protein